mmetsp:Transcript_37151/g.119944  ORF Transcript_37151/g.119944 Transcript_37151/m.119944 type:complete len:207 (-) Transcript_37151:51-671(-)
MAHCEDPPGSRLPRGARFHLTLLGRERRRCPRQPPHGRDKLAHKRLGLDSHQHLAIQRPSPAPLPVGHRGAAGETALQLHLDSRRPPREQARSHEVHDGHHVMRGRVGLLEGADVAVDEGLGDIIHQPRHAALGQLLDARAPQHVHVGLVRRAEVSEDQAAEACTEHCLRRLGVCSEVRLRRGRPVAAVLSVHRSAHHDELLEQRR